MPVLVSAVALVVLSSPPDTQSRWDSSDSPGNSSSDASAPDSRDDSVDLLAPYLGLTPLDADDLVEDARDDARAERPAHQHRRRSAGGTAPAWAALLPELHLTFQYNSAQIVSLGYTHAEVQNGFVVFVTASFGAGSSSGGAAPHERPAPAGVRWASATKPEQPDPPAGSVDPATPSIAEVQAAAERAALVRLDDLTGWKTRARAAAWLPALEADYRRNVGEIDTLGVSSNLGIDSHNLEDVSRYGVRASWQLSQIVFSPDEVSAAQAALDVQQHRQDLIARVTELYFERLRTLAKLQKAPPHESESLMLTAAELTAKIDALTNGFLSQRLASGQPAAPESAP